MNKTEDSKEHIVVQLCNIGLVRAGIKILNNISLSLNKEHRLAVIGPNGSGKSFLLRIISADMLPSSGEISILEQKFGRSNLWNLRRRIGFVSTRMMYELQEKLNTTEVVCTGFRGTYGLAHKPSNTEIDQANEKLRSFDLTTRANYPFSILSDGERRKVMLCRALVHKPKLLVFDEPCQGLDIPTRESFLLDIDTLSSTIPIIYATHHLEELPSSISHIAMIRDGNLVCFGEKDEVLNSKNLSKVFDYQLVVTKTRNKYYAFIE